MKNYILLLFFLVTQTILFGQNISDKYANLIKKADTYYRLKNYKASAQTFSQAFKSSNWKGFTDDRYNAARSWALAGIADSAFYQLNIIATKGNYTNYEKLSREHELKSLHKDKRWEPLLERVKQNMDEQEAKFNRPLIRELDSIQAEDQKFRSKENNIEILYGADSKEMKELWKTIQEKDSTNLLRVKEILDKYGWLGYDVIGYEGSTTLFLVIQHSDQKTQEKYLPIMRDAVKDRKADPSQLALLEDRVALGQGKKQIYGSQIIKDPITGRDTIAPIEDFANVDKRRAEVGLEPLEEYVSHWGIVLNKKDKKGVKKPTNIRSISNNIESAEEIHDSIIGPVNVSEGFGLKQDYSLYEYKEGNSAWFKLKFDVDTILTFDIVPIDPKADYDFILFKCPNSDCIDYIEKNKVEPERRCFSFNLENYSSTGLSEYYTRTWEGGGPGPAYVSSVAVKTGETFYLMVHYPGSSKYYEYSKGFTIYFYNYWPAKPKQLKLKRNKVFVAKKSLVLENVLFESGNSILLKESYVSLDKLVSQLLANKVMKIEIRGNTDNVGDETQNQTLSEERAKAVVDYLISRKIEKSRLSYKGFGSKQPIASNETEEGRKKNRRVEFVVLTK